MSNQVKIINYFKSVDLSFKSFKFSTFINCFSSTSRIYSSVNQVARTSQIAIDAISNLKNRLKSKTFKTSSNSSKQKYLADAVIDHTNQNIRVETSLTNAENNFSSKFNSTSRICSSVNQIAETSQYQHVAIDEASSLEIHQKLKSDIFAIDSFNSTSRICFSINQVAETSQYQHVATDKVKLLKSLKSAAIISSLSSTLRFSLSVNHDSLISSRIDFFRALINQQMTYVSIITRFSYRLSYQLASLPLQTTIHRRRRHSHMHLDIRVETTLKKKEE